MPSYNPSPSLGPRKPGRPPGSVASPEASLRREIQEWLVITKKCRGLVEAQLAAWEREMPTLTREARIEVLGCIRDIVLTSVKVVDSGTKNLNSAASEGGSGDSAEEILEDLLK